MSTNPTVSPFVREWLDAHPDYRIVDALPVEDRYVKDFTAVTVANSQRRLHLIAGERAVTAFLATPERTLSLALAQYGDRS